jgi:hypothetical protein
MFGRECKATLSNGGWPGLSWIDLYLNIMKLDLERGNDGVGIAIAFHGAPQPLNAAID